MLAPPLVFVFTNLRQLFGTKRTVGYFSFLLLLLEHFSWTTVSCVDFRLVWLWLELKIAMSYFRHFLWARFRHRLNVHWNFHDSSGYLCPPGCPHRPTPTRVSLTRLPSQSAATISTKTTSSIRYCCIWKQLFLRFFYEFLMSSTPSATQTPIRRINFIVDAVRLVNFIRICFWNAALP